jgi:hypothetical protein
MKGNKIGPFCWVIWSGLASVGCRTRTKAAQSMHGLSERQSHVRPIGVLIGHIKVSQAIDLFVVVLAEKLVVPNRFRRQCFQAVS